MSARFQNGRRVHPILFECGLRMYAYPVPTGRGLSAVERIWHIKDSQGQITALAFRLKSFTPLSVFPLDSEAVYRVHKGRGRPTPCSKGGPKRIWHIEDSQGQITALAFRLKSLRCSRLAQKRSTVSKKGRGRQMPAFAK